MKNFDHKTNDKYNKIIEEFLDEMEKEEKAFFIEDFCGLEFVEKHEIKNENECREKLQILKNHNFKIIKYFHVYKLLYSPCGISVDY